MTGDPGAAIPTWEQLIRFAPLSTVVCLLIYFGWYLRGDTIKYLREWIDELRKK